MFANCFFTKLVLKHYNKITATFHIKRIYKTFFLKKNEKMWIILLFRLFSNANTKCNSHYKLIIFSCNALLCNSIKFSPLIHSFFLAQFYHPWSATQKILMS